MSYNSTLLVKAKSRVKGLPADLRSWLGMEHHRLLQARGARMLVYHGVCESDPLRYNTLFITRSIFEKQLQLYKRYFHLLSPIDFFSQRFRTGRLNCCLSFDDGFANNLDIVLPLLERYEVPAVFFVTAASAHGQDILWNDALALLQRHGPSSLVWRKESYLRGGDGRYREKHSSRLLGDVLREVTNKERVEWMKALPGIKQMAEEVYWKLMTPVQLKRLAASKWVTIGSHGTWHQDFTRLALDDQRDECTGSKAFLESAIGRTVDMFAFPYGAINQAAVTTAREAGYRFLAGTQASQTVPGVTERLTINPFVTTINQLYANASGSY